MKKPGRSFYALITILAVVTAFLVAAHYVKAYSDPVGWLWRAESMAEGNPVTKRAPVYPAFLIFALKIAGPAYVFLANLPFLLVLLVLVYQVTNKSLSLPGSLREDGSEKRRIAAILAVSILAVENFDLFLELINPFRESLAFTLLMASVLTLLHYFDRRNALLLSLSGLLLGLSIGTRETGVLLLPSLGIFYIYHAFVRRDIPWLRAMLFFLAGLSAGMVPFMIQNALHTGHFWLPSYAASRWRENSSLVMPDDFPVPGMSFSYFAVTGKETASYFLHKYGFYGVTFTVLSLVQCIRKGYARMLLLVLPSALTPFLFYCFYKYVKARYLFMVDIFLVPFMSAAILLVLDLTCPVLKVDFRKQGKKCETIAALLAVALVSSAAVLKGVEDHYRFKAWDVAGLREAVEPRIKRPLVFFSEKRHQRQLLSWHLRAPYVEKDISLSAAEIRVRGLEEVMQDKGRELRDYVAGGKNVYSYGDRHQFLLKSWFDFQEVFDFADLSKPPDLYEKPMKDGLYQVRDWSGKEIVKMVKSGGGRGRKMLMVDFFRVWDYPDRTYCRLFAEGELIEERVPNGLHFVEIGEPRGDGRDIAIRVESDAPLAREPFLKVVDIGEEFEVSLGAGPDYWYAPLLSENFHHINPLSREGTFLFDEGEMLVPRFAGKDEDVFAVFRIEFFQEDPYFRKEGFIYLDAAGVEEKRALPGRRKTAFVAKHIGRGTGGLDLVPVKMRTTLPSFQAQMKMRRAKEMRKYGYAKLTELRLIKTPVDLDGRLSVDVGTMEDAPWLKEGFHGGEKHSGGHTARWTKPKAVFRLPRAGGQAEIIIRTIETRPEPVREDPVFRINSRAVPPEGVEKRLLEESAVEYRFTLHADQDVMSGKGALEILSRPWVPSAVLGVNDERELGIFLDNIEIVERAANN
jgi:hypothetical protein